MAGPLVHCVVDGSIATVTLDSPSNRNALSTSLVADLHAALDRAEADDVRVIVLTHTGTTFCAGADLRERLNGPVDSTGVVRALSRLMMAAQPTIAAVDGFVRAGGIGLMAACDLVVVPPTADFAFSEVRIGAAPAIISVPILRRCSVADIAAPFLTGEVFDASHARAIGLVSHVADEVGAKVAALCAALLEAAPGALAATKQILRDVPNAPTDSALLQMQQLSEALFEGAEAAEGMQAYFAKRAPSWAPVRPATAR